MKFIGDTSEYLHLTTLDKKSCELLKEKIESALTILWFEEGNHELQIDGKTHQFKENQVVFLTEFHRVKANTIGKIRFLRFNRPFYCILDHDVEVSCKGLLFFGASQLPIIEIPSDEQDKFETLWKMFNIEMESDDSLKIEMLQMMLKRYLILCARIYRQQGSYPPKKAETDMLREFNFLVEKHFKSKHSVSEYADLLHKSPKTLSNLFSKRNSKSPLQYIHDRKMLEARRLLHYSKLSVKEIAYEIGYDDIQTFSRFFKKQEGLSPSDYRDQIL